ncbi:MAG TPA: DUF4097 family beta strand repeat-containing protein [Actinomycetota bacterium]|nr:DUF4097 family beta strand repeat-containing protein [Actinomycetota bacterium]
MSEWAVRDVLDIPLQGLKQVAVRVVGGEVAVATGAGGDARLTVRLEEGPPVEVRFSDGVLSVTHPDPPEGMLLRLLRSSSATRRVSVQLVVPACVQAEIQSVSAPVVVSGLQGPLTVRTVSGDIVLDGIGSPVDVMSVSGGLAARDLTSPLKVQTVSGSVAVAGGQAPSVRAQTVSGDVALDIAHPQGEYSVQTVSGEVALRTPAEPSLALEASSVSGGLVSDFGLDWEGRRPGNRRLRSRLGDGGAKARVRTVSGTLRVARRREQAA